MLTRWTAAARKLRVKRDRVRYVLANTTPRPITTHRGQSGLEFIGPDADGIELEIILAIEDDGYRVIHAMPTAYRKDAQ